MSRDLSQLKVGLDCDGVLSCFTCGVKNRATRMGYTFPTCQTVTCWDICEEFMTVMEDAWEDETFWLNLARLQNKEIPFTPDCVITHRKVPSEVTAKWMKSVGYPEVPVITVENANEKLDIVKERGLDVFVDDYYPTVRSMREAGVNALLYYSAYQLGHVEECKDLPTIRSLEEISKYV